MSDKRICGNGAACETICPFKMTGRICPDTDDIAHIFNVAFGLTPQTQPAYATA